MSELKIDETEVKNYVNKYIRKVFKNEYYEQFNLSDCTKLINWQYQLAGEKKPIVFTANNPYESQVIYDLLNQGDTAKITELFNLINSESPDQSKIDEMYAEMRKNLDDSLATFVPTTKIKFNNGYLYTSDVYTSVLLGWYGYAIDILKLDLKVNDLFKEWRTLYENAGVYNGIYADEVCIVSKFPNKIYRNEDNNLHNLTGPAVSWDGLGWKCYYINGRNIDEVNYEKALNRQVTKNDFLKETNEEIKAAWYEILGQEEIIKLLEADMIDRKCIVHTNGESEIVELYKTKEKFEEIGDNHFAWVKFTCPSTGTNYLIDVMPHFTDALEAAVSTSPLVNSVEDYLFDERA
jgi:hypothetical protein